MCWISALFLLVHTLKFKLPSAFFLNSLSFSLHFFLFLVAFPSCFFAAVLLFICPSVTVLYSLNMVLSLPLPIKIKEFLATPFSRLKKRTRPFSRNIWRNLDACSQSFALTWKWKNSYLLEEIFVIAHLLYIMGHCLLMALSTLNR